MTVNVNVGLLFIDYTSEYMKIVKIALERNKRLPGEVICLVHTLNDGIRILREREGIELIVLHFEANRNAIRKALIKLRRVSVAQIMVIAQFNNEADIAEIYEYGADTWVPPIYAPELAVAYFENFYRRHRQLPSINSIHEMSHIRDDTLMQCGELTIDPARLTVKHNNKIVELTAMEFNLICFLARNEGILLTYEILSEHVWNARQITNHSIANRIHSLRRKIEPDPQNPVYILSKYGVGYRFMSK